MRDSSKNLQNIKIGNHVIEVPEGHIYTYPDLPREYDKFPISLIMHSIKDLFDPHFIDIGANVGDTLAHIRARSEGVTVTCIEPSGYFFSLLEKNSKQFKNVTLVNKFVSPKRLRNNLRFQSDNQTGFTKVVDGADADIIDPEKFLNIEDIFIGGRANIIKTDTDGFDLHIIRDALDALQSNYFYVPLIFFEGPSEENFLTSDFREWFTLFSRLVDASYKLLFLRNDGLPYINAGMNADVARSALCSLHIGARNGRSPCHYFDVIAYKLEIENEYLTLETPWPPEWKI